MNRRVILTGAILVLLGGLWLAWTKLHWPPESRLATGEQYGRARDRAEFRPGPGPIPKPVLPRRVPGAGRRPLPEKPLEQMTPAELKYRQEQLDNLAAAWRRDGVPEEDIQNLLKAYDPPKPLEDVVSPWDPTVEELTPEELEEEMRASLKELDIPPEDRENLVRGLSEQLLQRKEEASP